MTKPSCFCHEVTESTELKTWGWFSTLINLGPISLFDAWHDRLEAVKWSGRKELRVYSCSFSLPTLLCGNLHYPLTTFLISSTFVIYSPYIYYPALHTTSHNSHFQPIERSYSAPMHFSLRQASLAIVPFWIGGIEAWLRVSYPRTNHTLQFDSRKKYALLSWLSTLILQFFIINLSSDILVILDKKKVKPKAVTPLSSEETPVQAWEPGLLY